MKNIFTFSSFCRGSSLVERCPEEAGVGCSIHPRGTIVIYRYFEISKLKIRAKRIFRWICYNIKMASSIWKKIFIAIVFAVVAFYGLNELSKKSNVGLVTPKFVEKRNEVAVLLKTLASAPDTNLSALGGYEVRRDFVGALSILAGVKESNNNLLALVGELVSKTDEVIKEAEKIDDLVLRPQALSALSDLQKGNEFMQQYFKLRGEIFSRLDTYYSDFVVKGSANPPDVAADMQMIDQYAANARFTYNTFNEKIDLFDRAAGLK